MTGTNTRRSLRWWPVNSRGTVALRRAPAGGTAEADEIVLSAGLQLGPGHRSAVASQCEARWHLARPLAGCTAMANETLVSAGL
jgi:hypothetical protein